MGKVQCVWTAVYLNGDGSGNGMYCTDAFDFVGVFVSDLGGCGCVNIFLDVVEDGQR